MKRRSILLAGIGVYAAAGFAPASHGGQDLRAGGTTFLFWHEQSQLISRFTTPTHGWVAVGFNSQQRLQGTRFLIGAMLDGSIVAEEHLATISGHQNVRDLGLVPTATDIWVSLSGDLATMQFSFPHVSDDSEDLALLP